MTYKPRNVRKVIRVADIPTDDQKRVHFIVPARSFVVDTNNADLAGPGMHLAGVSGLSKIDVRAYAPADCPLCESVTEATTASAIAQGLRDISPANALRLGRLASIVHDLAELDRQREELISRRDDLVRSLWPAVGATTLARVVALTGGAVYKIVHRDSNRAVTVSEGTPAHEPNTRRSRGTP